MIFYYLECRKLLVAVLTLKNTLNFFPTWQERVFLYLPVSGVTVAPWLPPLVAFLIASFTTSAGVAGGVLLLPFQMSVLGFVSPSVSSTNLIYNITATPGGWYRYIREGRMVWPLVWVAIAGTLPGVFAGAWVRVNYLHDPGSFRVFAGLVLLYLGFRLLYDTFRANHGENPIEGKFKRTAKASTEEGTAPFRCRLSAGLPAGAVIKEKKFTWREIEFEFWGERYSLSTFTVVLIAVAVGMLGGIYGIGGGALIAPFLVAYLGLPVYAVAGASLAVTFLTSLAGVCFYSILPAMQAGALVQTAPDWTLGLLFGAGGLIGTYAGARVQKYLPERFIRATLGFLVTFLGAQYILRYLGKLLA
ncbi:MAG: Sulfite exporter TauE/SafE [Firmicutes bacterium ADurb.Bin456]|nr:MAG: Sulfite exporter TauE/SafE [Firmicutes bacterium ADurb.Bin456]